MKAIGLRYRLPIWAMVSEVFDDGRTSLIMRKAYEVFNAENDRILATAHGFELRELIGCHGDVREFVLQHGRPHGTIWKEETQCPTDNENS